MRVFPIPVGPEVARILLTSGLVHVPGGELEYWRRDFGNGRSLHVEVLHSEDGSIATLKLSPTIGSHTYDDHLRNADTGAMMMKIAMTLAEEADGTVTQLFLRGACVEENVVPEGMLREQRVLAVYPHVPLRFENLCRGFREVLLRGVGTERDSDAQWSRLDV